MKTGRPELTVREEALAQIFEDRPTVADKILKTLTEREGKVLTLRLGLDGEAKTFEEIGKQMGLSLEPVRRIRNKVLGKLLHPARRKILEESDDLE